MTNNETPARKRTDAEILAAQKDVIVRSDPTYVDPSALRCSLCKQTVRDRDVVSGYSPCCNKSVES